MRRSPTGSGFSRGLICALFLAAGLLFLAGCMATAPSEGTTPTSAATPSPIPSPTPTLAGIQSKVVHVTGNDRGTLLLVGRSICPWCMKEKELFANLSVDYYWVDLNILDQAETAQVMSALTICGDISSVPILVVNGQTCIIGYQEEQIREAVA